MADKTITSFFDRYEDAADAVRRLEAAGIPHRDISLIANNEGDRYSTQASRTWDENSSFDDDHDGAATGLPARWWMPASTRTTPTPTRRACAAADRS
jgi:hypothetical protein